MGISGGRRAGTEVSGGSYVSGYWRTIGGVGTVLAGGWRLLCLALSVALRCLASRVALPLGSVPCLAQFDSRRRVTREAPASPKLGKSSVDGGKSGMCRVSIK